MSIFGLIANIWNVGGFAHRPAVWRAAPLLLLAQVAGPCAPTSEELPPTAGDPATYEPVGCTPDARAIAARRPCQRDDQCPCGAHCELGVCVASCGAGLPACTSGNVCNTSGRCVPPGSDPVIAPVGTASGTVRFDSASVTLAGPTDVQILQYSAADTSVDRVRFAIEAPFEVRCTDGGQWARECTAGPLPGYAIGSIRVRVAQGSTVTPGQRGEVAAHTPVGVAKATVAVATEQTAPVFRVGRFEGAATMTILGRPNPATPEPARTVRVPIVAYLSGRPGVAQRTLEIEDKSTLFAGRARVVAAIGPQGGMSSLA